MTVANPFQAVQRAWEILQSDKIELRLYGDSGSKNVYKKFTSPHRLVPVIGAKEFGAALFKLPASVDDYLVGRKFEYVRRQRRKATKAGFYFDQFHAPDFVNAILRVNTSASRRQGREISASYIDESAVTDFCAHANNTYGIFDSRKELVAYVYVPVLGDICLFSRILGHADFLQFGIMYLLVTETIVKMIERRCEAGYPDWAMYDMFWGASPGLRFFKEKLGFRPYRVKWHWRDG